MLAVSLTVKCPFFFTSRPNTIVEIEPCHYIGMFFELWLNLWQLPWKQFQISLFFGNFKLLALVNVTNKGNFMAKLMSYLLQVVHDVYLMQLCN